ncbi:hypothetical protein V8E53_006411 [Lactarius tabidus]
MSSGQAASAVHPEKGADSKPKAWFTPSPWFKDSVHPCRLPPQNPPQNLLRLANATKAEAANMEAGQSHLMVTRSPQVVNENQDLSPTEGKSKKQKIIDLSNDLQASGENKHSQSSQGMLGNLIVAPVEDIWQALMGNCPTQATQLAAISGFHKCSLTYMPFSSMSSIGMLAFTTDFQVSDTLTPHRPTDYQLCLEGGLTTFNSQLSTIQSTCT